MLRCFGQLAAPVAICALNAATLLLAFFGLKIWGDPLATRITTVKLACFVAVVWFGVSVVRRAGEALIALRGAGSTRSDGQLIRVMSTLLCTANVARRRKFLFNPVLGRRYETTGAQLKHITAGILEMLARNPRVLDDASRVNLALQS